MDGEPRIDRSFLKTDGTHPQGLLQLSRYQITYRTVTDNFLLDTV